MLKKAITYTDYNGVQQTEEFYFNLTQAEVTEMEVSTQGGLAEKIQMVVKSDDKKEIVSIFKDFILRAYGVRTPDGKRFVKSQQLSEEFAQTEAYSVLFMELATNADAAATFINAVIPQVLPAG